MLSAGQVAAACGIGVVLAVLGFGASFGFLVWFAWATERAEQMDADLDALLDRPRDY